MTHANRLLATFLSRQSLCCLGVLGAAVLFLSPALAGAALSEYHMRFTPSASPLVAGYTMHLGTESGEYVADFDLGHPPSPGGEIVYGVAFDDAADLFVAISAYDESGEASPRSNEIMIPRVVPPLPPEPEPEPEPEPTPAPTPAPAPPDPVEVEGGEGETAGHEGGAGTETPGSGGESGGEPVNPPVVAGERVLLGLTASSLGELRWVDEAGETSMLMVDSLAGLGDVRPARCDLDQDGDLDLVLGFGNGSRGQIALLYLEEGVVVSNVSLTAGSSTYRKRYSGMTYPSCGDIDGDGRAEIVVGFGRKMRGRLQFFDDETTAFWPYQSDSTTRRGFRRLLRRDEQSLALFPAVGDVDGDGRDEVLVGTGAGAGSRIFILDDALSGFAPHPNVSGGGGSIFPQPLPFKAWQRKIKRRVALGDVDGDGYDEIVVSFGRNNRGQVMIFEDLHDHEISDDSKEIGHFETGHVENDGESGIARIELSDLDNDGREEIVIGFDGEGRDELQIFEDAASRYAPYLNGDGFLRALEDVRRIFPAPL